MTHISHHYCNLLVDIREILRLFSRRSGPSKADDPVIAVIRAEYVKLGKVRYNTIFAGLF